jgi:hypothetical protein
MRHSTDLYHFCCMFYWPSHVGWQLCVQIMLSPYSQYICIYMQGRTHSSFPHFPAHEPLPFLPIKRVHRGAAKPLLGGEPGFTLWTGPLSAWLHIVPNAQMEPDMETQELFKIGSRKVCDCSAVGSVLQRVVLRPPEACWCGNYEFLQNSVHVLPSHDTRVV